MVFFRALTSFWHVKPLDGQNEFLEHEKPFCPLTPIVVLSTRLVNLKELLAG